MKVPRGAVPEVHNFDTAVRASNLTAKIYAYFFLFCLQVKKVIPANQNAFQASGEPKVPQVRQICVCRRGAGGRRTEVAQNVLQVWYVLLLRSASRHLTGAVICKQVHATLLSSYITQHPVQPEN